MILRLDAGEHVLQIVYLIKRQHLAQRALTEPLNGWNIISVTGAAKSEEMKYETLMANVAALLPPPSL